MNAEESLRLLMPDIPCSTGIGYTSDGTFRPTTTEKLALAVTGTGNCGNRPKDTAAGGSGRACVHFPHRRWSIASWVPRSYRP
jgi:hypothetical protein